MLSKQEIAECISEYIDRAREEYDKYGEEYAYETLITNLEGLSGQLREELSHDRN